MAEASESHSAEPAAIESRQDDGAQQEAAAFGKQDTAMPAATDTHRDDWA
jgi:hypothetical protein